MGFAGQLGEAIEGIGRPLLHLKLGEGEGAG